MGLITLAIGSLAILLGAIGYRTFAGRRSRRQYHIDNVSEEWLNDQRRER
jgi:hypothetical protein